MTLKNLILIVSIIYTDQVVGESFPWIHLCNHHASTSRATPPSGQLNEKVPAALEFPFWHPCRTTTRGTVRTTQKASMTTRAPHPGTGQEPSQPQGTTGASARETTVPSAIGQETPAHSGSGQETTARSAPGQETPAHSASGQETTAHNAPDQETPAHSASGQETPAHSAPGQETPAHSASGQETPAHSASGQETTPGTAGSQIPNSPVDTPPAQPSFP